MRQVTPHLWLGNALDARDVRRLYESEIAVVVDLAMEEPPARLGRDFVYCRVPLIDGRGNEDRQLQFAAETIRLLVKARMRTLVACSGGMSRSPAIVAAALALESGASPEDCLVELVRDQPHDVSPPLWQDIHRTLFSPSAAKTSPSPPPPPHAPPH